MPILERNYLVDQRGNRKMAIAAVDHKETEKNIRNALRKERQIANANVFLNKSSSENTLKQISSSSSTTVSDSSYIADDFEHFLLKLCGYESPMKDVQFSKARRQV